MPKDRHTIPELANVHLALNRAVDADARPKLEPMTVKLDPRIKEIADKIMAQHGTTLGSYLRECCNLIVRDYVGDKKARELGIL